MSEPSRESEMASREMARAAEELSKAAEELRQAIEDFRVDYAQYINKAGVAPGSVGQRWKTRQSPSELPEEEVALIADKSVHRVRTVLAQERAAQPKAPPLTAEEIREWERRREERRKREAP